MIRISAIAALVLLLSGTSASAGVSVRQYTSPAGSSYTLVETARPDPLIKDSGRTRYFLGVNYDYYHQPLVELDEDLQERTGVIVDGMNTLDLQAGIELSRRVSLHLTLPLQLVYLNGQAGQFALGDLRLFSKIYAPEDWLPFRVAFIPELRPATGANDLYISDSSLGAGLGVALERDFGKVSTAVNFGYRYAGAARHEEIDYRQRLPLGLGVSVPFADRWSANAELMGILMLPTDRYQNPSEAYAGFRYRVRPEMVASLGGSLGNLMNPVSSGGFRVLAGLRWTVGSGEPEPVKIVKPKKRRVVFTPREIKLYEEVLFEHAKDVLTESAKDLLDEVAVVIKHNLAKIGRLSIEGHCNELGTNEFNQSLSEARALAVKKYLVSRGINPNLLTTRGFGKSRPKPGLLGLSREAQLEANRRVEFIITNKIKR